MVRVVGLLLFGWSSGPGAVLRREGACQWAESTWLERVGEGLD